MYGFNDFLGLLFVGWLLVFLTTAAMGGLLSLFYQLDEHNSIKVKFTKKK